MSDSDAFSRIARTERPGKQCSARLYDAGLPLPERVRRCLAGVNADFAGVLLDDVKVWPIYDVLCFSLIPAALRPKATAVVSVCWHTYISHVAARERCIAVD